MAVEVKPKGEKLVRIWLDQVGPRHTQDSNSVFSNSQFHVSSILLLLITGK
jgi:hypothetical protein